MLLDEWGHDRATDTEPVAESALEPERFPAAAELVLAQYVLNRGLRDGGNRRTIGESGEGRPSV